VVVPVALGLIFVIVVRHVWLGTTSAADLEHYSFRVSGRHSGIVDHRRISLCARSVGFIALLGITVLNGVVLVGYFNQLRLEGLPLREVVITGAKRRLRPVMMTASITAFGLIPLLFATGPGSEIQRPLAIVVIGGLITATALTLMLLPILYLRFAVPEQTNSGESVHV